MRWDHGGGCCCGVDCCCDGDDAWTIHLGLHRLPRLLHPRRDRWDHVQKELVLDTLKLVLVARVDQVVVVCLSAHRQLLRMPLGLLRPWNRRAADHVVGVSIPLKGR